MYPMYQMYADITNPIRDTARALSPLFNHPSCIFPAQSLWRQMMGAACDVTAIAGITHERPPFRIVSATVGDEEIPVVEEIIESTPFCHLLHFKKEATAVQPKLLVVAPVSGHFATLLRATVQTLLQDHDVYVTDWINIRDVPKTDGPFGLDEYVAHVIRFLEVLGPGSHLIGVCQPTVPALIAVAVMAEDKNPAQPTTMTLMAGPIDTRVNPTAVNEMATSRPIGWFEKMVVSYVPLRYAGAKRRVYPGFLQISAFMSMNMGRHIGSFIEMYASLIRRDKEKAESIREFYEEYFAMMDLPAEFYLETVQRVFQEHHLPLGIMQYRGRTVRPELIKRTALFTIEGEKDDICSIGQTLAAQELCTGVRPFKRKHHVQNGVGHYGVFSGRRWEMEVYPLVRDFIYMYDK